MNTNQNALIAVVLGAVVILGAILYFGNRQAPISGGPTSNGATSTPPAPEPTPTPTPTPQPSVKAPTVQMDRDAVPTNSTAVVTGRVTPNGAPTTYWYEYGETTALGTRTAEQSIGSGFATIPATGYITGLKANTTYYFRLSARNRISTVNSGMESFRTNDNPPPPRGTAPGVTSVAATEVTRTTANLNGRVDPNQAETKFWFEYGEDQTFGRTTAIQSAGDGNSAVAVANSVSGLKPLTKYYFRLNAQNQFGTVNGAILTFTTRGPPAPTKPGVDTTAATNVSTSTVTMNARIDPNGAATSYWFEYSEDSLLGSLIGSVSASQTISGDSAQNVSVNVSGLERDTKYYYRAVARNEVGTTLGDIVSFTTRK